MQTNSFISIIIPCRNEEQFIGRCLDSWVGQNYPREQLEILVIDGYSEDKTRDIVREYACKYPFVRLLDNEKKITPVAFNKGISKARGDFLLFAGAHANYTQDYLAKCMKYMKEYGADVVGGVLETKPSADTLVAKAIALALSHPFGTGGSAFRTGTKQPVWTDTVFGGCYTRKIVEKTGFFNENLVGSQDMEFNLRLKKAGGRILLVPDIPTVYYPKGTIWEFFMHNVRDGIWAILPLKFVNVPMRLRHYLPLVFVLTLPVSIWPYLLTSLFFSARIAVRRHDWRLVFAMPVAFGARHVGYGLGSLWGAVLVLFSKVFKGSDNPLYFFYRGTAGFLPEETHELEEGYWLEMWEPGPLCFKPRHLFFMPMLAWWAFRYFGVFWRSGYRIFIIYGPDGDVAHYSVVLPAHFKTPFMDPDDLQIGPVGTNDRHRRRGLASAAIREILSQFRDRKGAFWYIVRADNEVSQRVIEKIGFERVGEGVKKKRPGLGFFDTFVVTCFYGKTDT